MLTTILGLAILGLGARTAGKLGIINVDENFTIMGTNVSVEFNKQNPFKIDIK